MKNLKSLQVLALAGLTAALVTGCSSTSAKYSSTNSDPQAKRAAFRFAGSASWSPLTDIHEMGKLPPEMNPVSWGERYTFAVPVANKDNVVVTQTDVPQFSEDMQPGEVFTEAAGAPNADKKGVRRVIIYTPYSGH